MKHQIDLNCDLGESYGAWRMGDDDNAMQHISSANIACGFHAGDPATMRATVAAGWLASRGFEKLDIYLGSMGAWKAAHD